MKREEKQKIGILGGTFDPVHLGHLTVARRVLSQFQLDRVLFIPAPAPPHKERSLTPFVHRVAMLEAALEGEPGLHVSILEAERTSPSYTVETLEELHRRLDPCKLFLVIGADMFVEIKLWYRYEDLFHLADLIVAARPGFSASSVAGQVAALTGSFTFDAEQQLWQRSDGFRIYYLPDTDVAVSSSSIRQKLAAGKVVQDILPAAVKAYIHRHGLYGTPG